MDNDGLKDTTNTPDGNHTRLYQWLPPDLPATIPARLTDLASTEEAKQLIRLVLATTDAFTTIDMYLWARAREIKVTHNTVVRIVRTLHARKFLQQTSHTIANSVGRPTVAYAIVRMEAGNNGTQHAFTANACVKKNIQEVLILLRMECVIIRMEMKI